MATLIEYDGRALHDPAGGDACATRAELTLEANKAPKLVVDVPPTSPLHGAFRQMSPTHEVRAYVDGSEAFRGRITSVETTDEVGTEELTCEGQLAYLNDTRLPSYGTWDDGSGWEVAPANARELLLWYVSVHDRQCDGAQYVEPGYIGLDTTPISRSSTQHPTVGAEVKDKLLSQGYGYATCTTGPGDSRQLNVYPDGLGDAGQELRFGVNLLDYSSKADGSDVVTAIRPKGRRTVVTRDSKGKESSKDEDFDLSGMDEGAWGTSCHVSGGVVYSDAGVAAHGVIMDERSYDGPTTQAGLAQAAAADLAEAAVVVDSVEVSAVDLSRIDPSARPLRLLEWARVVSEPLGVDQRMMVVKVEADLLDPSATRYTLGSTRPSITDSSVVSQRTTRDELAGGIQAAQALSAEAKASAVSAEEAATGAADAAKAAQSSADGAQKAADGAKSAAATAQATADSAKIAASAAQTTADSVARSRSLVATCGTAAATAAKVATLSAGTLALAAGATVSVIFSHANSAASPTLDVGGTGARPILTQGSASAYWAAGAAVSLVYSGDAWNVASAPVYASTADVGDPGGRHVHVGSSSVDVMDGSRTLASFGDSRVELGRGMEVPDDSDSTRSAVIDLIDSTAMLMATVLTVAKGIALKVLEIVTPILRIKTDKMVSLSARHDRAGSKEYSNVLVNAYVDLAEDSTGAEVGNAPVLSVTCAHRDASGTITDQTWALTHEGIQGPGGAALPVYRAASRPQEADYAAAKPCVVACDDGTTWLIS